MCYLVEPLYLHTSIKDVKVYQYIGKLQYHFVDAASGTASENTGILLYNSSPVIYGCTTRIMHKNLTAVVEIST